MCGDLLFSIQQMNINKSLFSINKLNQNLVSFACSQCVRDLGVCGGSWRYGFVLFTTEVCLRSGGLVSMSLKVCLVIYI